MTNEEVVDVEIGSTRIIQKKSVQSMRSEAHLNAIRKTMWSIVPVYMLIHFTNYIDRGNISFAASDIKELLGLDDEGYAQIVMYFGITYTFLQIPAQHLSKLVGARRFLTAILIVWSIAVALTGLCQNKQSFIALRLIIGAAEAGAFPATYLHIDSFLEAKEITFSWGLIMSAAYAGTVVAGPLAAGLVYGLEGQGGLEGWRWMFIVEGIFGFCVAIIVFFSLTDSIGSLTRLDEEEKQCLFAAKVLETVPADASRNEVEDKKPAQNLAAALTDWRAWYLGVFNFCIAVPVYAFTYFSPLIIKTITGGHDGKKNPNIQSDLLNAIPYLLAALMMIGVGKSMYIFKDRFYHSVLIFISAILLGSTLSSSYNDGDCNMWGVFAQVSFYYMFVGGAYIIGDTVAASFLSQGGKAAGGYAIINTIKSSSSIVSPSLMGWLSVKYGNTAEAIPVLSIFSALALLLLIIYYVLEGNIMDALKGKAGAGGGGGDGRDGEEVEVVDVVAEIVEVVDFDSRNESDTNNSDSSINSNININDQIIH